MWHEARKQERKIRGMLVDYRKRAERRRDFYEKIKADPTQFLQIHGRQCKIHLDPTIAAAAEGPATMMPWQGQSDNLIDRFDVRAHLDFIPNVSSTETDEITHEERQMNYERYRIIAQNAFLGINEEKFLKQLHLEEQFGYTENEQKKKKQSTGVAIGFNYEDGTGTSYTQTAGEDECSDDNSDSDLDVDLSINISKIDPTQAHEMNRHGRSFGMSSNDFYSFLTNDLEEAESFKLAKEEEHEKALFSGRKSRRERRAHREKRLANRKISPPSYAAKESPTVKFEYGSDSPPSPENSGKITFITSFGDEEEPPPPAKPTYADKVKYGNKLKKLRRDPDVRTVFILKEHGKSAAADKIPFKRRPLQRERDHRRDRSRNARRSYTSSSRSRSRSKSRSRSVSRSRRRRRRNSSRSSSGSSSSSDRSRRKRARGSFERRRRRFHSSSSSSSTSRSRSKSKSKSKSPSKSRSRSRSKSSNSTSSKSRSRSSSRTSTPTSVSPMKAKSKSPEIPKSVQPQSSNDAPAVTGKSPAKEDKSGTNEETKPLPRYYGRKRSDQSSSEISEDSSPDDTKDNPIQNTHMSNNIKTGNSGTTSKATLKSTAKISLAERLKRKRQAQLNKQFKADKIAEQMKTEREKQEQQTRDDELRELALKFRRKHREMRHAYDSESSDSSSRSRSKSPASKHRKSRSPSPPSSSKRGNRSRERDFKYRSDRDERRYRGGSRDRDRERDRDWERDRTSRDRDRDRYRRSPRYDDKRNDDRYHRDERRKRRENYRDPDADNQKTTAATATKSLVDY